jgi:ribonuclease J
MDLDTTLFNSPQDPDSLRIIPMGGVGEFGMNITAYLYRDRLLIVDCGVRFPEPHKLGVNGVIPSVGPFFAQAGGVFAYVMTHGHEDHIGALPYILSRWPAPLYATPWTIELIKARMRRLDLDPNSFALHEVSAGDRIKAAEFDIELVHVNHSIPMTCSLVIRTPTVKVFHTGDFKLDPTPVGEPPFDPQLLKSIGETGIDLLVADSTNSDKTGRSPSESLVLGPLTKVFKECSGAIICSTFASNLWRLKIIADACIATGRRLFVAGAGLEQTLTIGKALHLYHLPENLQVSTEELSSFPRNRLVVLATGCQGEWRSALVRISAGEHKDFAAKPGDTLVLSARIIPGNEKQILGMCNGFLRQGVAIITTREHPGIHVSGHAYREDLELLFSLLKPKNYMPVHGAYSQLLANHRLASDKMECFGKSMLVQSGDVIDLTSDGVRVIGEVSIGLEYVDAEASVPLPAEILRDRLKIGELGLVIVTGTYDPVAKKWISPAEIDIFGLAFPDQIRQENWISTERSRIESMTPQLLFGKLLSIANAKEEIRIYLRRKLHQVFRKKPVVIVKINVI